MLDNFILSNLKSISIGASLACMSFYNLTTDIIALLSIMLVGAIMNKSSNLIFATIGYLITMQFAIKGGFPAGILIALGNKNDDKIHIITYLLIALEYAHLAIVLESTIQQYIIYSIKQKLEHLYYIKMLSNACNYIGQRISILSSCVITILITLSYFSISHFHLFSKHKLEILFEILVYSITFTTTKRIINK